MAIFDSVSDELKKVQQQKRDLVKREKDLKKEKSLEKDMDKWKGIMDVKAACLKLIEDANLGMRMSLSKLDKFPEYYIYQHPTIRPILRTDNRKEEWVKMYLGEIPMDGFGGTTGVEADLLDAARKSRLSAWKRVNKKKKTISKLLSGKGKGKGGSGKDKAVRNVGVG